MTYFISFYFDYEGLSNLAFLCKLNNNYPTFLKDIRLNNNPYEDIFFIAIDEKHYYYNFIATNMEPMFKVVLPNFQEFWIFCVKFLHKESGYSSIHNANIIFNHAVRNYLRQIKKNVDVQHYIITKLFSLFSLPKTIYLVEQIDYDSALKIIKENEALVLWHIV
jgi:hypothetical protein